MYLKIKEIIVVEGKHDSITLKQYFECDTIETSGLAMDKETLDFIKKAKEQRGVILFMDPDSPGEKIRHWINQNIAGCKNAFIEKQKARTSRKVGIEHASKEDLMEALQYVMTYQEIETISLAWDDFIDLGFQGLENSKELRIMVGSKLHLGKANAKTLYKRLNMLQITKKQLLELLEDYI